MRYGPVLPPSSDLCLDERTRHMWDNLPGHGSEWAPLAQPVTASRGFCPSLLRSPLSAEIFKQKKWLWALGAGSWLRFPGCQLWGAQTGQDKAKWAWVKKPKASFARRQQTFSELRVETIVPSRERSVQPGQLCRGSQW